MESLKYKTSKSVFWVAIDAFGQKLLQFIFGIILARLLLPQEFGIIGLLSVFFVFSQVFIDSGFSFALIRKKHVADIEYNTVFWFNLFVSIVFYFILFFSSEYIANFYHETVLSDIAKVIGLLLIINAMGSTQSTRLRKELKFKELTICGIISKIISGIISIILAFKGFGVWSLVIQQLLMNGLMYVLMVWYSGFWLKLEFSFIHIRSLFSFSSKLILSGISYSVVNNIYPIVIGRIFSTREVGFFYRAQGFQQLPVMFVTDIIQKVSLPIFATIQDQEERFLNAYRSSIKTTLFLVLLPLTFFFVAAYPLISVLITDKWLPSAPMLQILAIGGIFYPVSALNVNLIGIKGRSDYMMITSFLKDGLTIVGLIVGSFFGIYGLICSFAITGIFCFFVNIYYTSKTVNYSIKMQLNDIISILLLGFSTGAIVYSINYFLHLNSFYLLAIDFILTIFVYYILSKILKVMELNIVFSLLKNLRIQK